MQKHDRGYSACELRRNECVIMKCNTTIYNSITREGILILYHCKCVKQNVSRERQLILKIRERQEFVLR